MPPVTAPEPREVVRNRTTADTCLLADDKIDEFLLQWANNVDLATAEALEYLARNDQYQSVSRGVVSVSGPMWLAKAATYRARGEKEAADQAGTDAIQVGMMNRAGVYPIVETSEYGGYAWPNTIFS